MTSVPRRRSSSVLTALGVLLALWLGLTAPGASPVAGPPAVTQPTAADMVAATPPVRGAQRGR